MDMMNVIKKNCVYMHRELIFLYIISVNDDDDESNELKIICGLLNMLRRDIK